MLKIAYTFQEERKEKIMKKRYLVVGVCAAMLLQSMTVLAAPKQMSDGTFFDAEYYAASNPDVKAVLAPMSRICTCITKCLARMRAESR